MPRYQIFTAANTATLVVADSTSIINSAGWAVNMINTSGIAVNVINTSGLRTHAAIETDSMSSSGTLVTVNFGTILAAQTNNTIVTQQANKTIRVLAFEMMADGATQCRFESGTANAVYLTGYKYFGTSGGMVAPYNPVGWFQTNIGSSLNLEIATAGASIGGCLTYLVL